jgi:cytochrome oxidase Cu insertion factor (SCO1/SenC/PrrC family)
MISGIDFHQYRMGDCGMLARARKNAVLTVGAIASLATSGAVARAQQTATPTPAVVAGPSIKDIAPDFTLAGATRYGLLKTPVTLADFRGRTVVLAFFYQARTKG